MDVRAIAVRQHTSFGMAYAASASAYAGLM